MKIELEFDNDTIDRVCAAVPRPPALSKEQHMRSCLLQLLSSVVFQSEHKRWCEQAEEDYKMNYTPIAEASHD